MREVEALSRAGESVFTALRPYDLHDCIVWVVCLLFTLAVRAGITDGPDDKWSSIAPQGVSMDWARLRWSGRFSFLSALLWVLFSALILFVKWQKAHLACKNLLQFFISKSLHLLVSCNFINIADSVLNAIMLILSYLADKNYLKLGFSGILETLYSTFRQCSRVQL